MTTERRGVRFYVEHAVMTGGLFSLLGTLCVATFALTKLGLTPVNRFGLVMWSLYPMAGWFYGMRAYLRMRAQRNEWRNKAMSEICRAMAMAFARFAPERHVDGDEWKYGSKG